MIENNVSTIKQEPSILDSLPNQLKLAKMLENVYENRPNIKSFVGAMAGTKYEKNYSEEVVEKDELYVKKTLTNIEEYNRSSGQEEFKRVEGGFQLSEILQAMVIDRLNNHWFKEFKAIMTSEFDDLAVGMDGIMKHKDGGYLGLSLDFTVTNKEENIYKKLSGEWENVEKGEVRTVKYFEDPDTKEKGCLLVPKFIIGASKKDVEELASAYLNNDTEVLENHPLKYVILLQIQEQVRTVLDYYEIHKDDPKIQFAKKQYEAIEKLIPGMKNEIQSDKKMFENIDLYKYTKENISLDTMRRFSTMRQQEDTL